MNNRFKKTLNSILNVITTVMIVILFFAIVSNFQTNFMGKKYNSFFGYTMFEIKTASMAGFTEIGDWVLVKETKDVSLNDVITFEENGSFVTHRVLQIYNNSYVTKGDSNNSEDVPVEKDQIVGVVVKVLPKFAFIKKTLLNTKVIILFLIALILGNSIFIKEDDERNFKTKIKKLLSSNKKEYNDSETCTSDENNNIDHKYAKQRIVYVDVNSGKRIENDKLLDDYPIIKQLEKIDDLSNTVVLSKITVNKSKTVNEMKDLINERSHKNDENINVQNNNTNSKTPGIIEL